MPATLQPRMVTTIGGLEPRLVARAPIAASRTIGSGMIIQRPAGKSPYIGDNGNWFAYDDDAKTWIDTGVKAQGPKGDPGTNGNHSTAEQWTGKLWVDGRKIYTKTVNFGVLPNDATKSVSHGVAAVARAWIDPLASWCHAADTGETRNLPFASPGLGAAIETDASATGVRVRTAADLTAFTECHITILYLCTNR